MRVLFVSLLLGACCRATWSFVPYVPSLSRNKMLRFLFRRMTRDSKWPVISDNHLKLEECMYFNESIDFPKYFMEDFHAYTGGNLNPVAAKEASGATSAVMKHHYKHLSGSESSHFIRSGFSLTARSKNVYASRENKRQRVVDFGCGIGVSTRYLRHHFENDKIMGIDLSPFYLEESGNVDASFVHGNIESTGIRTGTIDVVCISYVLHELPKDVSFEVLREAARILKRRTGVIAILDMHRAKSSSPLMKYIFDRTEPYLGQYGELIQAIEEFMGSAGFEDVDMYRNIPKTIMMFAKKK